MKVGLLTSEKIESSGSLVASLNNYLLSKGMSSQIISLVTNPDISSLRNYDVLIVKIREREYLWLAQYLEEIGTKVINSYKALSLSSNKLISG